MKKALMNASVASMIYKFNMNNIDILEELGYQVDVACNFGKENPISEKEIQEFRNILKNKGLNICETDCPRSLFSIKQMIATYKQLKELADNGEYDLVHTQSPIGGVLCRLAFRKARKKGTKIIYQAHGFHFYKGAPLINWILYYPIEKICSRYTDVLITINQEDYGLAQKHMCAKKVVYVPGVGVDVEKFLSTVQQREKSREELGCISEEIILVSVGEINKNKNHQIIIKALAHVKNPNIKYWICGQGEKSEYLQKLAAELGVARQVEFWGYQTDIKKFLVAADIFCFPSIREGLGLAAVEAMSVGLPLITSNIHGINDYSMDGVSGYSCNANKVKDFKEAIENMSNDKIVRKKMGENNKITAQKYDIKQILLQMRDIYKEIT